jgi:septum formation protein
VILLASQSVARANLLTKAGIPFQVIASTCNEDAIVYPQPQVLAVERARAKARAAQLPKGEGVCVAADTVTAVGNVVVGTPRDLADAERILGLLQGTTHTVFTGHCCRSVVAGKVAEAVGVALAKVTMRSLTPQEIRDYVKSGEGMSCSGAYAVQAKGDRFILDVEGCLDTVIGLNLDTVARLYRECTDRALPGYVKT